MTIYYYGEERPKDAPSWARPISEVYEPPYQRQPIKRDSKPKPKTKLERSLLFT